MMTAGVMLVWRSYYLDEKSLALLDTLETSFTLTAPELRGLQRTTVALFLVFLVGKMDLNRKRLSTDISAT